MANQIVLLVLGFLLTTVAGGALGYYLQRRMWDANRRESERTAAERVFDEVSRAMDERLYRMRRVYWGLKAGDEDRIAGAMVEYRSVLTTWNDNLNRNLALAYRFFGREVWEFLGTVLYEEFAIIGRHLEKRYRQRNDEATEDNSGARLRISGKRLVALSNDIFELNRVMIAMIQQGEVGLYLSDSGGDDQGPWNRDLLVGSRNTQVVDWQRRLVRVGYVGLEIDGWFGQATHEATIAFQTANGLKETDGVVDVPTRRKMAQVLGRAL